MKRRFTAAMIAVAWFTAGPGISVTRAQCTDNAECSAEQYCEKRRVLPFTGSGHFVYSQFD